MGISISFSVEVKRYDRWHHVQPFVGLSEGPNMSVESFDWVQLSGSDGSLVAEALDLDYQEGRCHDTMLLGILEDALGNLPQVPYGMSLLIDQWRILAIRYNPDQSKREEPMWVPQDAVRVTVSLI